MVPKSLLQKDIASILSSAGADEFIKDEFSFKGRFKQNAEVIYDDRAVGYCNTFVMSAKDFFNSKLKLKDILTHKESGKSYKIVQILSEVNVLKRLVLEEIKPQEAR
ncbi:hypothetical protein [Helicobacter sp. 13S00477-4]|uniref:hypothetical protein n=1 Tax=Helicobacter sp. 13S00477-4 TaxID=1905759 RepID=UPI000BA5B886|nr:hypothetical protein [Helicobacter sp. 13S00477-4]PAF50841.1 hypothetical protein BKH44_06750 [Helicobacter sp. 13S00477-4]